MNFDPNQIVQTLTASIRLALPPIAICFTDMVPAGIRNWTGRVPAGCRFWQEAATEVFATSPSDHDLCAIGTGNERYFLVLFQQDSGRPAKVSKSAKKATPKQSQEIARLERELDATRDYLQSIIEEQEAMNEELRSANEEIQSSNEELQSTNEELETAKEELQSSNEELTTLNEELANRNDELARALLKGLGMPFRS